MLRRLAAAIVAATTLATAAAQAQSLPIPTTSGMVQGNSADANGVTSFKGIPYAAPPVGTLRWHAPVPALRGNGVLGAFNFGAPCISPFQASPSQSEDCLTLNVWTPNLNPAALKPVMVWIHGGGFQFDSSANPTYNGSNLAAHDVVVVTLNYRLGVLGFLADSQLDTESGTSGNWGLMDQVAALNWVQQNIANFGGDPSRVTVFGESGGAHAVGLLLSSPRARGLINGAILESGAFWDSAQLGSMRTHAEALAQGAAFAAKFPGQDLRAVDAMTINAAAPYDLTQLPINSFSPTVDGNVLPVTPAEVFARRQTPNIPLLGGWNAAEYLPFTAFALPHATAQQFDSVAANLFGNRCLAQFQALYPANSDAQATPTAFQLTGDQTIAEQTWEALSVTRQPGAANAYAYNFTYTSPFSPIAGHVAEVPFVFGTIAGPRLYFNQTAPAPTSADQQISSLLQSYWTNFAKTGNPNGPGLPAWPSFTGLGGQVLQLSANTAARANTDEGRFAFLASYRSHGRFPAAWRNLAAGNTYPGVGCGTATFKP